MDSDIESYHWLLDLSLIHIYAAVANAKFEVPEIMVEDRISQMVDEMRMSLELSLIHISGT